nr:rifin PIR protein,putative [Plasmodium sp. DRC-Itaito]
MDKFTTLQTDIQNEAIPTCICEKSISDKVQKGCLRCGGILGSAFPELSAIGGTVVYVAAVKAAIDVDMKAAIEGLKGVTGLSELLKEKITYLVTPTNFKCPDALITVVQNVKNTKCVGTATNSQILCILEEDQWVTRIHPKTVEAAGEASEAYISTLSNSTTITTFLTHPIVISAIVVISIALILLIIYLILRYRRKKKKNEEKITIYKIIKIIDMFCYVDVGRKFGTCIIFLQICHVFYYK